MNYEEMNPEQLITELDDLIQFKLVKASNTEWVKQSPELVEYRKLTKEIYKRMEGKRNAN